MRAHLLPFPIVCLLAVARAGSAPASLPSPRADDALKRTLFKDLRGREPELRQKAAQDFPTDPWSRDDAFHAFEADRAEELARKQHVALTDVLAALDDGIRDEHSRGDMTLTATVPPCHPRAIY